MSKSTVVWLSFALLFTVLTVYVGAIEPPLTVHSKYFPVSWLLAIMSIALYVFTYADHDGLMD